MAFFIRRVRNRQEAEDLTQEVFVRMLGNSGVATGPDSYIFQIAANLLTDRARRSKVRLDYAADVLSRDGNDVDPIDPLRISAAREDLARALAAMQQLTERQRTIFLLYRVEQMSQEAIAEAFGISKSAVKKNVAKAMAAVMAALREVSN